MLKSTLSIALIAGALLLPGAALAFDPASLGEAEAKQMLHELVRANVAAQNCEALGIGEDDDMLVMQTADTLAGQLQLDIDAYEEDYFQPAFDALEAGGEAFCSEVGAGLASLMARLRA